MKLHRSSLATITCLAAMSLSGWQSSALAGSEPRHATSSVRGVYDQDGNIVGSYPDHTGRGSILFVPVKLLETAAWMVFGPPLFVVEGIGIMREEAKVEAEKAKLAAAKPPPVKHRVRRR